MIAKPISSCESITASYKLSENAKDTYYYAKRSCTVDPEDGKIMGTQYPADQGVAPPGYVNIKQYNQRSTNSLGNTAKASFVSIAKVFGNLRKIIIFNSHYYFRLFQLRKQLFRQSKEWK